MSPRPRPRKRLNWASGTATRCSLPPSPRNRRRRNAARWRRASPRDPCANGNRLRLLFPGPDQEFVKCALLRCRLSTGRGAIRILQTMNHAPTAVSARSASPTTRATLDHFAPYVLSVVRIVAGLLFFEHGLSKLFGFPSAQMLPHTFTLEWFAGIIEFGGGGLIALGLFTRAAALIASGEM